jgi:hypothetical protein
MRLEEYFNNQKYKMPEQDKLVVFDNIKTQISQQSIFTKVSFYSKVWIYTVFLLFIFFGLFIDNKQITNNIKVQNNINTVNADYIWKVIKYNWTYKILDNEKTIDTNILKKWNILILDWNTKITLWINKWIKLHLLWPAKIQFTSYKNDKWKVIYVVNMLDGNYLSVKSNSKKDKIIIKSSYFNIESDNNELIDLKYTNKLWASIIKNNGWNILIKKNDKIVSLKTNEQLVILEKDSLNYIKDIFDNNYKQYQLDKNWNLKTVISSEKIKLLWNILNRNNVVIWVWRYVLWKLNNDDKWINFWKNQTIDIIINTYKFFWFQIPDLLKNTIKNPLSLSLSDEELLVNNLIQSINDKYIIPAEYMKRLKVILAYLVIVDKMKVKKWVRFNNLSDLVNYLKLENNYKKVLLTF